MSSGDGCPIKKQLIQEGYDFRKASVRLDTFVDSAPMPLATPQSKLWFSPGLGFEKSQWGLVGAPWKGIA
jgi:hypothetical protein